MYNIAICDDMHSELDKIEKMLMQYSVEKNIIFNVQRFEDAAVLLKIISAKEYIPNLIIVDIYIKEISGIDAVTKLREGGFDIPVIFLTVSSEYALEAYNLDALQYLLKPLEKEKFFHALDISLTYIGKNKKDKLVIKMTEGICSICSDEIIYCETRKNYQMLFLEKREYKTRMTSLELNDILKQFPQFVKCGSSYIFNMNHIVKINKEEIHMDNGNKVYIPKNKVSEFTNMYIEYFCKD